MLLRLVFHLGALAGYTGAVFERFFGTVQGMLLPANPPPRYSPETIASGRRSYQ